MAFKTKKIKRIFARSFEQNIASIKVLEGTGFIYQEGHDEMQLGGKITLWELENK